MKKRNGEERLFGKKHVDSTISCLKKKDVCFFENHFKKNTIRSSFFGGKSRPLKTDTTFNGSKCLIGTSDRKRWPEVWLETNKPPKFNSSPLKNDASSWGPAPIFRGKLAVELSGSKILSFAVCLKKPLGCPPGT